MAELALRVDEIARTHDFTVSRWDEDGLGEMLGFAFAAPSGRIFLVKQLTHDVERLGRRALIVADAGEVAEHGPDALRMEALSALGVGEEKVTWMPGPEVQQACADDVRRLRELRSRQESAAEGT